MPQTSVDPGGRLGKTGPQPRTIGVGRRNTAPLGDKPSHDLKSGDPFDLCHLVFQEQDVARVIERAAEAYRTLPDIYCKLGILEALVIFDHSMDMACNLCILDR